MENERVIRITKDKMNYAEENYFKGKASYSRVVERFIGNNMVLCNKIADLDYAMFENRICGFSTMEEIKADKLEELKQDYATELENGEETLEHLEELAEEQAEEEYYNDEFYQYFIIDISQFDIEYLKECGQTTLQILYSDMLDCYVLAVGHCGTSWDYVSSDFKLEIV